MFNEIMQRLQAGETPRIFAKFGLQCCAIPTVGYELESIDGDEDYQLIHLLLYGLNNIAVHIDKDDTITKKAIGNMDFYDIIQCEEGTVHNIDMFTIVFF